MSGDEPSAPIRSGPKAPAIPAAPVVLVVQMVALLGLIGYAMIGLMWDKPLDARVIASLVAFGLGLRPSTIGDILRRMLGVDQQSSR